MFRRRHLAAWRTAVGASMVAMLLVLPAYGQVTGDTASPGYFMPPSPVISARPSLPLNPVIVDRHLTNNVPPPPPNETWRRPLPWYKTDWGVASIGLAATGLAAAFDHGINHYTQTKISYRVRHEIALKAADAEELLPLAFAGLTMVQSSISDPKLAHASSIAFTAAGAVTVETMAIKYVVGRARPTGPNSDPFVFHPFDAAYSSFSVGAVFPGAGTSTSSFPSGHTALAFALITPYAELYHAPALYLLPISVGVERIIATDGHWTSDVVGGAFLGWLTADMTRRFFPNSDYGVMLFGDGHGLEVGLHGRF